MEYALFKWYRAFWGKPNTKTVRVGLKRTISYHLGWNVIYGIKAIAQPKIGKHVQAHKGRQRGR
jgi:hypothetical protein